MVFYRYCWRPILILYGCRRRSILIFNRCGRGPILVGLTWHGHETILDVWLCHLSMSMTTRTTAVSMSTRATHRVTTRTLGGSVRRLWSAIARFCSIRWFWGTIGWPWGPIRWFWCSIRRFWSPIGWPWCSISSRGNRRRGAFEEKSQESTDSCLGRGENSREEKEPQKPHFEIKLFDLSHMCP